MADRQNAAQTLLHCIVQSTWDEDLHVLPASPMLEGAERELMSIVGAPYRLAESLSRIANRYAAIIIDTRPSLSLMTEMGLIAANDAIVPAHQYRAIPPAIVHIADRRRSRYAARRRRGFCQ